MSIPSSILVAVVLCVAVRAVVLPVEYYDHVRPLGDAESHMNQQFVTASLQRFVEQMEEANQADVANDEAQNRQDMKEDAHDFLPHLARNFAIDDLIHREFHIGTSSLLQGQCAGSSIIHRAYGAVEGELDIHVVPHKAIFHDGEQCGSINPEGYLVTVPWRNANAQSLARANGLSIFFDVVNANGRAKNAIDQLSRSQVLTIGLEMSGPRVCGEFAFPNQTIFIFMEPTDNRNLAFSGLTTVFNGEVGMLTLRPDRELCLYKDTRKLADQQPAHRTRTPTPTPLASKIVMSEDLFDLPNRPDGGIRNLFPVVSVDITSPSVTPTVSVTSSVTPTTSVSPSITPTVSMSSTVSPTVTPSVSFLASVSAPIAAVTVTATITVTPSATPVAATVSAVCFPGNAVVIVKDKGRVDMSQLRIGDLVLVGGKKYSPVIASTHNESESHTKFVRIHTVLGYSLTLSEQHYVPTKNRGYQTGSTLQIGDVVNALDGKEDRVVEIECAFEKGLYNPHTIDGTIVVDGIVVSTFTKQVPVPIATALLAPLRGLYVLGLGSPVVINILLHISRVLGLLGDFF